MTTHPAHPARRIVHLIADRTGWALGLTMWLVALAAGIDLFIAGRGDIAWPGWLWAFGANVVGYAACAIVAESTADRPTGQACDEGYDD